MFRSSLLFFALSIASFDCAHIPDLTNSGNVGFHIDPEHRNVQFGEGIRDWFRNMKEKVFGRDSSSQLNSPSPLLDLNPESALKLYKSADTPERLMIQPGNVFVDLTNLKFDNKDWGFRIGNWYIIRKSAEESYSRKNVEDWTHWQEYVDSKNEDEKHNAETDYKGQKANEYVSNTSTIRALELENSVNAVLEDGKETGNENDAHAREDLSVEVLKPAV